MLGAIFYRVGQYVMKVLLIVDKKLKIRNRTFAVSWLPIQSTDLPEHQNTMYVDMKCCLFNFSCPFDTHLLGGRDGQYIITLCVTKLIKLQLFLTMKASDLA